jgi:hypothetical protein
MSQWNALHNKSNTDMQTDKYALKKNQTWQKVRTRYSWPTCWSDASSAEKKAQS